MFFFVFGLIDFEKKTQNKNSALLFTSGSLSASRKAKKKKSKKKFKKKERKEIKIDPKRREKPVGVVEGVVEGVTTPRLGTRLELENEREIAATPRK